MRLVKCKDCGGDMEYVVILTNPATDCYKCRKCGRHIDEKINMETIIK